MANIYCTDWLRVTSCQEKPVKLLVASRRHTRINIFKFPIAKSEIPEHKMERRTYEHLVVLS